MTTSSSAAAGAGGLLAPGRSRRGDFLLAEKEIYLNAGTFSALPRCAYAELIRLIAIAEANPTMEAAWRGKRPLWQVQQQIARYVGAAAKDILFHPNVTEALNQAIFSLPWPTQGEILVSDQEYGAIANAVHELARRQGLTVRSFALPRNPRDPGELRDAVLAALTPATVGLLLSHITSATGMVTPVEELAPLLRQRGVRFLVDGAHAPGLIPLELGRSQIDIYGGNLHKWLMGPKGTGFLYVDRSLHEQMQPHVVGWGGTPQRGKVHDRFEDEGYRFQYIFRMQGLRDFSPFLALPAVLEYRAGLGEEAIRGRIAQLTAYARKRLEELGLSCLSPQATSVNVGLVTFAAPAKWSGADAMARMHREHGITVALWGEGGQAMLRVSPHIWNSEEDIDRLAAVLRG